MEVPNTKFHGNPSSGSALTQADRQDGHDETNRHFSRLCERPKNITRIETAPKQNYL